MLYDDHELLGVEWTTETSLKGNPDPSRKRQGKSICEDASVVVRCGYGRCSRCNCSGFREADRHKCDYCGHSDSVHSEGGRGACGQCSCTGFIEPDRYKCECGHKDTDHADN